MIILLCSMLLACGQQPLPTRAACLIPTSATHAWHVKESPTSPWSLPGGRIEPGESYAEAAARETEEELNTRANTLELLGQYGDTIIFKCEILSYPYVDGYDIIDLSQQPIEDL